MKLYHDHGGKLRVLRQGGDTFVQGKRYTRWICAECKTIVLVPKEMVPA